ncbi:hypothetical protein [Gloeobacter morelensis]|uniref:Uncharacterized protein n=1 Tax=Gloeobacter morelensis MG652769 TaxID=2781736 RepID=A0ABY3PRA3_9CYAN|nr:hypothetical protein [Gloeobacter morelensis]UFP95962.1 hypothetical protein ISF26_07015 [Gloeobacter morelensis MG652769]
MTSGTLASINVRAVLILPAHFSSGTEVSVGTNEQYTADTEEPTGFGRPYPVDNADTGDVELFATGADLGDAGWENFSRGLNAHGLEADNTGQLSYDTAFGELTDPQAWYDSDLSVHRAQQQPHPWIDQQEIEPAFEDPAADACSQGAEAFATGEYNVDGLVDVYGGEPFVQGSSAVSSDWEATTLSWENTGEKGAEGAFQDSGDVDKYAPTRDAFPDSGVSQTSLAFDNEQTGSDDSAAWEPFSEWVATDKTDVAGQDYWAIDSASIDAQEGVGDESPRVLQAQLRVEVDGADAGELASTTEEGLVTEWLTDVGKASLSGLGLVQELTYPIWKQFEEPQGKPKNFNLSFRDISGFPEPTGHAYINRMDSLTGNPQKWKGLRLDYGPFPVKDLASGNFKKDPLTGKKMYEVGWHWNQDGSERAFGIKNHTEIDAGTFPEALGRTLKEAKQLGRAALVGGVFLDAWAMGSAIYTGLHSGEWNPAVVEGARITGGWAGGWAAAQAGGGLGATLGTTMLPGVGTIVGGAVGGLAGGALGYFGGSAAGEAVAEQATGVPHPKP